VLSISACVSTQLEVEQDHPGHRNARTGLLQRSTALSPQASQPALATDDEGDHAGHDHGAEPSQAAPGAPPANAIYTCPMHPEIVKKEPGNCPICGMKLVPKKAKQ
jgi:Cu+-exporting ATPase